MTVTAKSTDRLAGSFARAAKSLVASGNIDEALRRARYDGASESALALLQQKAASPAASLGDAEWAANVANQGGASVDFVESLRPQSLFFRFTQRAQNFPLYQSLTAFAALETGGEIAEAAWVPVVAGSTEQTELLPRKTGGVVVMSRELIDATDPASFAVFRRELQRAAVASVDDTFLAILADEISASPIDPADFMGGLEAMAESVTLTGAESLVFMAGTGMARKLAFATALGGEKQFPNMGLSGGRIIGVDVWVSDRLPAGRLVLADASGFLTNEGSIDVDVARGAALKMQTDPAAGAAQLVSLFQTGARAVRVIAAFGCDRHRDEAVAIRDLAEEGS